MVDGTQTAAEASLALGVQFQAIANPLRNAVVGTNHDVPSFGGGVRSLIRCVAFRISGKGRFYRLKAFVARIFPPSSTV